MCHRHHLYSADSVVFAQSRVFSIPVFFQSLKWEYSERHCTCPLCSFMQEGFPERKHTQHPLIMIFKAPSNTKHSMIL